MVRSVPGFHDHSNLAIFFDRDELYPSFTSRFFLNIIRELVVEIINYLEIDSNSIILPWRICNIGKRLDVKLSDPIENVWKQYTDGDKERFKDLYLHYYAELYAYGKTISHRSELIDGAIQELFIRLWEKTPRGVKAIDNYIFISFRNQLLKQLKRSKWYSSEKIYIPFVNPDLQRSPEEEIIHDESKNEINSRIRKALESLPVRRKEAIFLKYFQNKSTREISAIMDIREEMVRNYIHKGIKTLRKNYSEQLFLLYSVQAVMLMVIVAKYLILDLLP